MIQDLLNKAKTEYSQMADQYTALQNQLKQLDIALYRKEGEIQAFEQIIKAEVKVDDSGELQ